MELHPRQIVMPAGHVRHSNEYLSDHRVYLLHIVNPETGRCFCGRDPEGWDMPYREYHAGRRDRGPAVPFDDLVDNLCRSCKKGFIAAQKEARWCKVR